MGRFVKCGARPLVGREFGESGKKLGQPLKKLAWSDPESE